MVFDAPNPLLEAARWLDEAAQAGTCRNPHAMAIATCDRAGRPANRMVLLRGFDPELGVAVFYTNYSSRKGRELLGNARAAGVLYWEGLGRQLRLEGPVTKSPDCESDAYFATRPAGSQLNAWVSEQSTPIGDPAELMTRRKAKADEFGLRQADLLGDAAATISRPAGWGGFRILLDTLEFWTEGADRFHERRRYTLQHERLNEVPPTLQDWRFEFLQP
jgi:pyridoxamine-phosphate oxidase